uniref:Uncharacterized protein n=1 Tax=Timema genevievae TaxID=629358 RepID=A0A7R9JQM8_TIMGE|nr:unnamed protein product [Timema genevievae]
MSRKTNFSRLSVMLVEYSISDLGAVLGAQRHRPGTAPREVVLCISHSLLRSFNIMKPRSEDWAVAIAFLQKDPAQKKKVKQTSSSSSGSVSWLPDWLGLVVLPGLSSSDTAPPPPRRRRRTFLCSSVSDLLRPIPLSIGGWAHQTPPEIIGWLRPCANVYVKVLVDSKRRLPSSQQT